MQLLNVDCEQVFAVAIAHDLSVDNASHLWLARALGVELVTLNKKLAAATRL